MGRKTPWEDEYTLLCERCGYVLEGLDPVGNCPECGKAIYESLPERRVGTAWQQARRWSSLIATWYQVLFNPFRTLDRMTIDDRAARRLFATQMIIVCVIAFLGTCATLSATWVRTGRVDSGSDHHYWLINIAMIAGTALSSAVFVVLILGVLTIVETCGMQFIGNRRSLRMTPAIAWSTCAHGAFGWTISVSGVAAGGFIQNWANLTGMYMMLGSAFAGFLVFEIFAWLGLRRCKFANRVRPVDSNKEPVADARGSLPRAGDGHGKEPGA